MPLYEIDHALALDENQQDRLAEEITRIHTTLFTTPSNFVHCVFQHSANPTTYMAGKKRRSNIIKANIRTGPTRTQEHYETLCTSIHDAWTRVVGEASSDEKKLRAIFVLGNITTGWESGFMIPAAGKDREWLEENLPAMQKMSETDIDMKDMLEELRDRKEFQHVFADRG